MDKQINSSMGNEWRFTGKQNLGTEVQHLIRAHQDGEILRKIVEKLTQRSFSQSERVLLVNEIKKTLED